MAGSLAPRLQRQPARARLATFIADTHHRFMQSLHYLRGFAEDPQWPDRDRVLAAPDAPALAGPLAMTLAGPPGLAFGVALGLALAERLLAARFGRSLVGLDIPMLR